jgi:hypothetical protein
LPFDRTAVHLENEHLSNDKHNDKPNEVSNDKPNEVSNDKHNDDQHNDDKHNDDNHNVDKHNDDDEHDDDDDSYANLYIPRDDSYANLYDDDSYANLCIPRDDSFSYSPAPLGLHWQHSVGDDGTHKQQSRMRPCFGLHCDVDCQRPTARIQ